MAERSRGVRPNSIRTKRPAALSPRWWLSGQVAIEKDRVRLREPRRESLDPRHPGSEGTDADDLQSASESSTLGVTTV
jgi:hypothetical protein